MHRYPSICPTSTSPPFTEREEEILSLHPLSTLPTEQVPMLIGRGPTHLPLTIFEVPGREPIQLHPPPDR